MNEKKKKNVTSIDWEDMVVSLGAMTYRRLNKKITIKIKRMNYARFGVVGNRHSPPRFR